MIQTKTEFIQAQRALYPNEPISSFVTILNDPTLVANPVPQGQVPIPMSILAIAENLSFNDRRLLQNEGAYESLLKNVGRNDLLSAMGDIENLTTTPDISQAAIPVLNAALASSGDTQPDPNWQAQIMLSPAQQAGFDIIRTSEVVEALS